MNVCERRQKAAFPFAEGMRCITIHRHQMQKIRCIAIRPYKKSTRRASVDLLLLPIQITLPDCVFHEGRDFDRILFRRVACMDDGDVIWREPIAFTTQRQPFSSASPAISVICDDPWTTCARFQAAAVLAIRAFAERAVIHACTKNAETSS